MAQFGSIPKTPTPTTASAPFCRLAANWRKRSPELRTAIRLEPELADAHYNLGTILKVKGKLPEAVEEFRNARDNAEPGSELAELIDRELVEADQ